LSSIVWMMTRSWTLLIRSVSISSCRLPALVSPCYKETFNKFFYQYIVQHFLLLLPLIDSTSQETEVISQAHGAARRLYCLSNGAVCQLMASESVNEAHLWIKGREFTVTRLFCGAYGGQAERYAGGALAIFSGEHHNESVSSVTHLSSVSYPTVRVW